MLTFEKETLSKPPELTPIVHLGDDRRVFSLFAAWGPDPYLDLFTQSRCSGNPVNERVPVRVVLKIDEGLPDYCSRRTYFNLGSDFLQYLLLKVVFIIIFLGSGY